MENLLSIDEVKLLKALRRGNAQAFECIFDQYWKYVFNICRKSIGNHEEAKEMTQRIFQSVWERRATLEITSGLSHYLSKAAKFQVYNYYRDQERAQRNLEVYFADQQSAENTTENAVMFMQLQQHVADIIERLPAQSQLVFRLSKEQELTHKQIAAKLRISVKTVEYHLANAKKHLSASLKFMR